MTNVVAVRSFHSNSWEKLDIFAFVSLEKFDTFQINAEHVVLFINENIVQVRSFFNVTTCNFFPKPFKMETEGVILIWIILHCTTKWLRENLNE